LYIATHSQTSDTTCLRIWDSEEIDARTIRLFILDSSKGLAEMTKGTKRQKSTVQFIHESVRDYLRKTGFEVLAPDLVADLTATTHAYMYRCCRQWVSDDVSKHLALPEDLPKAKSEEAKILRDNATVFFPFLEYCVSNLIYHAEMACGQATSHVDFVSTIPLSSWLVLNNVLAAFDSRRHLAPLDTAVCIFARKKAWSLLAPKLQAITNVAWGHENEVEEALHLAIANRNPAVFAIVLMKSITLKVPSIVIRGIAKIAIIEGDVEALQIITQHCTPPDRLGRELTLAIRSRDVDVVRELLQWCSRASTFASASIRSFRMAWMFNYLVSENQVTMVQVLLDHAKSFNGSRSMITNSLWRAASSGSVGLVRMLLAHGADVEHRSLHSTHPTPLLAACAAGHTTVVEVLLAHGASCESSDDPSSTPLIVATESGHDSIVQILIQHGAAVNWRGVTLPQDSVWEWSLEHKTIALERLSIVVEIYQNCHHVQSSSCLLLCGDG
jgi:hypothetical protein